MCVSANLHAYAYEYLFSSYNRQSIYYKRRSYNQTPAIYEHFKFTTCIPMCVHIFRIPVMV